MREEKEEPVKPIENPVPAEKIKNQGIENSQRNIRSVISRIIILVG